MRPVGAHALLSDCNGAALVDDEARVAWWCAPRFDSPSAFSALLDPEAGHLSLLEPDERWEATREYVDGTLVLVTELRRGDCVLRVTDCLGAGPNERGLRLGEQVPHALVRVVECLGGACDLQVEVVPRFEYGLTVPRMVTTARGPESVGGCERLFVDALDLDWSTEDTRAVARPSLRAGDRFELVLRRVQGIDAERPASLGARAVVADTVAAWRSWSQEHCGYEGPFADEVRFSARVLQGLTYQPTGAVVGAPTTSLPDRPGSEDAAWDYRYGWLRDAGLIARALDASHDALEADRYFSWMAKAAVTCGAADHVQVMYGVEGERDLTERVLGHLAGRDGAPVRVGNDAWKQTQLDVLGEVLGVAARRADDLHFDAVTQGFLRQLAERAARDWREPDRGIWEWRDRKARHTASLACCWMALDRAVQLAPRLGDGARPRAWRTAADEVRATVLDRAWDPDRGVFLGTLDDGRLDCAAMLLVLTKLLDAHDPRAASTCRVLQEELGDGTSGLVRRTEPAVEDIEDDTAFLLCSGWLAECHARGDRIEAAEAVLTDVWSCATDLGLLAERATFDTREPVGNVPLGLSHASFITGAVALRDAMARREQGGRAAAA